MSSEEIRIRYQYRKLILAGKVRISLDAARALVGPDCAFHLYGLMRTSGREAALRRGGGSRRHAFRSGKGCTA